MSLSGFGDFLRAPENDPRIDPEAQEHFFSGAARSDATRALHPTPSLISKDLSKKFRRSLALMLGLDVIYYFIGSFVLANFSAVDMGLLFLGYYAQDLLRVHALYVYGVLSAISVLVDGVTLVTSSLAAQGLVSPGKYGAAVTGAILLYLFESCVKLASIVYSHKLRIHLTLVPGQSFN
eukprot:tig00001027_g6390.t1